MKLIQIAAGRPREASVVLPMVVILTAILVGLGFSLDSGSRAVLREVVRAKEGETQIVDAREHLFEAQMRLVKEFGLPRVGDVRTRTQEQILALTQGGSVHFSYPTTPIVGADGVARPATDVSVDLEIMDGGLAGVLAESAPPGAAGSASAVSTAPALPTTSSPGSPASTAVSGDRAGGTTAAVGLLTLEVGLERKIDTFRVARHIIETKLVVFTAQRASAPSTGPSVQTSGPVRSVVMDVSPFHIRRRWSETGAAPW